MSLKVYAPPSNAFAPKVADWVDATVYPVGELVVSGGALYRVTTAHTSSGSFDATKFTALGGGGGSAVDDASLVIAQRVFGG